MSYDPPVFITVRTPVEYRLPVPRVYAYAELELTAGGGVSTSAPRVVIEAPQGRRYARCYTGIVYDTDTDAWPGIVQRRHGRWYLADTGIAQAAGRKIGGLGIMAERVFAGYGPAVSAIQMDERETGQ